MCLPRSTMDCSNGAAYCTGRGEIVEDVEPPLPLTTPVLLVRKLRANPITRLFASDQAMDMFTLLVWMYKSLYGFV